MPHTQSPYELRWLRAAVSPGEAAITPLRPGCLATEEPLSPARVPAAPRPPASSGKSAECPPGPTGFSC